MTAFTLEEVEDRPADLRLLHDFYAKIYVPEFPDANERESLENMCEYLRRKRLGWYGANNYHILIAKVDGQPVGCAIADYLAEANAGAIEFLTVAPPWRGRRIGSELRNRTEFLLAADSARTGAALDYIVAEMNDPFRTPPGTDNMDPVARALFWHRWGYRIIDFPYVQPALSPGQLPVETLCLIVHIRDRLPQERIPVPRLLAIIAAYMKWAMRIEQPIQTHELQEMARRLAEVKDVAVDDLADYAEGSAARSVHRRRPGG
jgi:GNAT superfamily N-acetyltransferase